MPLVAGASLGPYQILALLGAGGMGEVYRARDTKLNRDVALKVLRDVFMDDPERVARFQREAQLLASLNHPNIATIHGLEESNGVRAIVLELVDGPTLAEIIQGPSAARSGQSSRGTAASEGETRQAVGVGPYGLSIDDVLPIARQIAEALEAAHDQGVIHRDLKPANIKVTPDGKVKVLDFGLAKLMESATASSALTMSPTLSVQATHAGVILGTAAYMSPEQARGKPVDRRADVWAFGCVLFEMLTGRQTFDAGDTVSDAVASILKNDPDWTRLPTDTPSVIRSLLRRCLQKDVQKRLPHIGVARLEIEEALLASIEQPSAVTAPPKPAPSPLLPWAIAMSALVGAAVLLLMWSPWRAASPRPLVQVSAELGADASLATDQDSAIALSPDGRLFVFASQQSVGQAGRLYIRRLEQLKAVPLEGTEFAHHPFFSADGQWVAFFTQGKLKKVSIRGGAAVTLCCDVLITGRGGSWAEDGTITFAPQNISALMRVPSAGGTPEPVTTFAEGEVAHRWVQVLPGGKAVLYTEHGTAVGFQDVSLILQPLPTGARKMVQAGGYYGRYVPSGHLLYLRDTTLFAAPFDIARFEATGPPVPVLEGIASNRYGGAQFVASDDGTLAYVPARASTNDVPIQWMDRKGSANPLRTAAADWSNPIFSPDGRRLAFDISDGKQTDVWVYEWARDTLSRLTFGPGDSQKAVWTPDGRRMVFSSTRDSKQQIFNLYWQRADGTGEIQRLTDSKTGEMAWSWHPSGKFLAYHQYNLDTRDDILILPIEGDEATGWNPGKPIVFLNTAFAERAPMFSPDGRWLAYQSTDSGRDEIYVRPFPAAAGKWQISSGGGAIPTWSRIGHELFYATPTQQIMVVSYTAVGDSFVAEKPRLWSEGRFVLRQHAGGPNRSFDLHPDGNRFALAAVQETQTTEKQDKVVFIFNFFDELRRLAPAKR
jgi:serine/threonine protein kinase/Tol biopolymer transport system component